MLVVACIVTLLVTGTTSICPVDLPCGCHQDFIACAMKGLTQVPKFRPTSQAYGYVMLYNNNITRIEDGAFSNITAGSYMTIELSNNNIDFIGDDAFLAFENSTTLIHLEKNNLKSLPRALLSLHRIYSLSISGMTDLNAEIMMHLGQTLAVFDLDMAAMNTSIWPPGFKSFKKLSELTVSRATLTSSPGYLPKTLEKLTFKEAVVIGDITLLCGGDNLNYIYFKGSHFSNFSFPACKIPSVGTVTFNNNEGLKRFPTRALVTFPNLYILNLENNDISDMDLDTVPNNTRLSQLNLESNRLTSIPAFINKMTQLRGLFVSNNKISSLNNGDLNNLVNLYYARFDNNPISFVSSTYMRNCNKLAMLSFKSTSLTSVPETFHYLTNLLFLYLSNNSISTLNEGDFNNLSSLVRLDLDNNPISFIHKNTFTGCPNLVTLMLTYTHLTSVPDAITYLSKLEYLHLSNNNMSALNRGDFPHLNSLHTLALDNTPMTSISTDAFLNCPNLHYLSLRSTLLTTLPRAISSIHNLKNVDLTSGHVRCDCELAWALKEGVDISGNCFNSTTKILDFVHQNANSCAGGTIIG